MFIPRAITVTAVVALTIGAACTKDSPRTTPADDSALAPSGAEPSAATPSRSPSASSYIGVTYQTPPAGVKVLGGAVLSNDIEGPDTHALTHVATPRGDMLWLDSVGASITSSRVVLAELPLPPLASDERLFISSCDVHGKLDPQTIAIVVNEPNVTRFTRIRQAWRVDLRTARFNVVPIAGIVCEDPGS